MGTDFSRSGMGEIGAQSASAGPGRYLTFAVSKERYGFEIVKVQEIIKVANITVVPRSAPHIKGVINLRGKIIPVLDLRIRFGIDSIPYNDKTCVIVIYLEKQGQRMALGVIVDTVLEVIDLGASDIEPVPNYGDHLESSFITGMGKHGDHLNILVDIERIVTAADRNVVSLSQG